MNRQIRQGVTGKRGVRCGLSAVFVAVLLAGCGEQQVPEPAEVPEVSSTAGEYDVPQVSESSQPNPATAESMESEASQGVIDELGLEGGEVDLMPYAIAELEPTDGFEANGTVAFFKPAMEGEHVRIIGRFEDLAEGAHGFHIHETGDCSAPDASSAGGHYNPDDNPHASRGAEERHMGDLGNLIADENGLAQIDIRDGYIELEGSSSIDGKAVVLHQGEDDLTSQPSGDAGARVSCGVIMVAQHSVEH